MTLRGNFLGFERETKQQCSYIECDIFQGLIEEAR